jgi:hypothetical protein
VKVLLGILAAILFAGAIAYFLFNTTTPFSQLRVKEEAAANAPVAAGGSPSSSRTVVTEQPPAASRTVSTAIQGAVSKVKSWLGQIAPPPKPQVARVSRPQPKVAAVSPSAASPAAASPHDANVVTITRDVSVQIKYGIVGLRRGTKVVLVSRDGATVHVRDATGETLVVPISATDVH